jgi:circadian clock protein KaiB
MARRRISKDVESDTAAFERAVKAAPATAMYVLVLYVAGINTRSAAAIRNVTQICEENLKDRYELKVIDLYQQPTLAKGEQIIAAPTLIKKLPFPLRRIIGDMANKDRILVGLDLRPKKERNE